MKNFNLMQEVSLDIIRIVAAYVVLLGHGFSFFKIGILKDKTYFPSIAAFSVIIFFLLSGFLLMYSLEKHIEVEKYSFKKFFIHRFIRIYREYIPALLMIALIDYISISINPLGYHEYQTYNLKQFIGNIFMLQRTTLGKLPCLDIAYFGTGAVLWTLVLEWWFNMIGGILFFILKREKASLWQIVLLVVFIFIPIDSIILGRSNAGFIFSLGAFAYYFCPRLQAKHCIGILLLSTSIWLFYALETKMDYTVYTYILFFFMFCSALCIAGEHECPPLGYAFRVIRYLSKGTFMLYLIHYSIFLLLLRLPMHWTPIMKMMMGIILSIALSLMLYFVFGTSFVNKLLRKYKAKR